MSAPNVAPPQNPPDAHWARWALLLLGLVALLAIFYFEEDFRGKRAWQQTRSALAARGQSLDWKSYVPPRVPDEQNAFAAPMISTWFVGRGGNSLSGRMSSGLDAFLRGRNTNYIVKVTVVPAGSPVAGSSFDLELVYESSILRLVSDEDKMGAPNTNGLPADHVTPAARAGMTKILREVADSFESSLPPARLKAAAGFTTFVRELPRVKPTQILVRAQSAPEISEVEQIFPRRLARVFHGARQVWAEPFGTNQFHIHLGPLPYTAAADYLAWTAQFEPEFELIREAVRRPYARMGGNYQDCADLPMVNFVAIRSVVQALAQRAQCFLLLGRSEEAFRDLGLIHDLSRILELRPSGKPLTFAGAMIHVAITGLYTSVVAEGLRLGAWREPQLAAIQRQLEDVQLLLLLPKACAAYRASLCRMLEDDTFDKSVRILAGPNTMSTWERLTDPQIAFAAIVPQGWTYQNMKTVALRSQEAIDCFDDRGLVLPHAVDALRRKSLSGDERPLAYSYFELLMPDYGRAILTTARNQTMANEALVACALERYRLVRGNYPPGLGSIGPELLEHVPADIIGGGALKFHLESQTNVVLYSIGWNGKDDGGMPGKKEASGFDVDHGDWVWPSRTELQVKRTVKQ